MVDPINPINWNDIPDDGQAEDTTDEDWEF